MSETDYQQLEILNKHLLDTNKDLGKEIKRLKEEYVMLQNASDEVEEELQKRIDKAIEYIDKHSLFEFNGNSVRDNRARMDLLNILRGVDKE